LKKETSNIWYICPLFLGLLGGILAYIAIKDDDYDKAVNCLWLGFGITVLLFIFYIYGL